MSINQILKFSVIPKWVSISYNFLLWSIGEVTIILITKNYDLLASTVGEKVPVPWFIDVTTEIGTVGRFNEESCNILNI